MIFFRFQPWIFSRKFSTWPRFETRPCGLSNRLRWTMDSVFGMPLAVHKSAVLRLRTADRLDLSEDVEFPWNSNGCNGCFFHLTKKVVPNMFWMHVNLTHAFNTLRIFKFAYYDLLWNHCDLFLLGIFFQPFLSLQIWWWAVLTITPPISFMSSQVGFTRWFTNFYCFHYSGVQ